MGEKIRVLVVDDSAVVRQTLTAVLESDPEIVVMGTAGDPYLAASRMRDEKPDVITLDVEMPRMDGLTFLRKLMKQHPIPVVMCSSLTEKGADTAIHALEYGAVEIITKPKMGVQRFLEDSRVQICDAVKAAAQAKPRKLTKQPSAPQKVREKLDADVMLAKGSSKAMLKTTEKVVLIGASTGGTEALREVLSSLPVNAPGIVVVQHMPEKFTASFAKRLDEICAIHVREARANESVTRGKALIAPGNHHTMLKRSGAQYLVDVRDGPLVSRHRPSVDVLFRSASRYAGRNAVGVIMTGMGDDGAKGMAEMKEAGATNIAQDEASCVVFGMPDKAIKAGGVDHVVSLGDIADAIMKYSA